MLRGRMVDSALGLADHGFPAGCVDLYDGAVASIEDEAQRLRRRKRPEPTYRTLRGCLRALAADQRATALPPAVFGFSMSAHWAVWLCQHPDPPIGAVVLFYAARAGDFSMATAPVMAHFAEVDPYVSASSRTRMERAIARRGLRYAAHDYPATTHWFAEAGQPALDADATDLAIERSVDFYMRA